MFSKKSVRVDFVIVRDEDISCHRVFLGIMRAIGCKYLVVDCCRLAKRTRYVTHGENVFGPSATTISRATWRERVTGCLPEPLYLVSSVTRTRMPFTELPECLASPLIARQRALAFDRGNIFAASFLNHCSTAQPFVAFERFF